MGLDASDTFSIEWAAAEEMFDMRAVILVECYGALVQSTSLKALLILGDLKSKTALYIGGDDVYVPLGNWRQAIIVSLQGMQDFLLHILGSNCHLDDEDALEIVIEVTQSLEEGCNIRNPDYRLN